MKRPRINRAAICSSKNYEASRRIHRDYLMEEHIKNAPIIEQIEARVSLKKTAYVKVFGELVPISEEEISKYSSLTIVYK